MLLWEQPHATIHLYQLNAVTILPGFIAWPQKAKTNQNEQKRSSVRCSSVLQTGMEAWLKRVIEWGKKTDTNKIGLNSGVFLAGDELGMHSMAK